MTRAMMRQAYCPWLASIFWQALLMPGAVLLQAGQHDLVAVIHLGPAETRDVARAGIMALLLRRGGGCDQNQAE